MEIHENTLTVGKFYRNSQVINGKYPINSGLIGKSSITVGYRNYNRGFAESLVGIFPMGNPLQLGNLCWTYLFFFGGLLDRKIPYPLKPLTLNFMNLRLGSASCGIFIGGIILSRNGANNSVAIKESWCIFVGGSSQFCSRKNDTSIYIQCLLEILLPSVRRTTWDSYWQL